MTPMRDVKPTSTLHRIDDAIFAVERVAVVFSLCAMVLLVFFEVVDRRLSAPESKLAGFLSLLHVPKAEAVAPFFGAALLFGLFWFGFSTMRRRAEAAGAKPFVPAKLEPLLALVATGVMFGLGLLMLRRPSNEFYAAIWALCGLLFAASSTGRRRLAGAVATPLGALAMWLIIPEGYSWAKEFSMILLVWTGLVGASMASHEGRQIDIDMGRKLFPKRARVVVTVVAHLVAAAFAAFIVLLGVKYVFGASGLLELGGRMQHTGIPDWIVALAIPYSFAMLTFRALLVAKRVLRERDVEIKASSPNAVAKKLGDH
jgi:TRAP-type C4-dicarboxylate transport system permease small subunit